MTTNEIKNRVADSGIVNVDLSDYAPKENILELDLKQFLFDGLVLKEKEFRVALKEFDFIKYDGKVVAVRLIAEQHIREDLGWIPSFQDWAVQIRATKWMIRGYKNVGK